MDFKASANGRAVGQGTQAPPCGTDCEEAGADSDPNQKERAAEPMTSADIHAGMAEYFIFRHERASSNYPCIDTVNELITNHLYLFLIMLQGN